MVLRVEASIRMGDFSNVLFIWLTNIPKNFVMALPFQLIIAGPLVEKIEPDVILSKEEIKETKNKDIYVLKGSKNPGFEKEYDGIYQR